MGSIVFGEDLDGNQSERSEASTTFSIVPSRENRPNSLAEDLPKSCLGSLGEDDVYNGAEEIGLINRVGDKQLTKGKKYLFCFFPFLPVIG
jgi:hypothetical protein